MMTLTGIPRVRVPAREDYSLWKSPAVVFQVVVAVSLVMVSPYAMTFTPYERIYIDGVWGTAFESDPLYTVRATLIIGGLAASILSLAFFASELLKRRAVGTNLVVQASMAWCSFELGWRTFPYWINGIFQAYCGNAPLADFDPGALLPMVWIGGIWYLGVLLVPPLYFVVLQILLILNFDLIKQTRPWKEGIATLIFLLILVALFFLFSPRYGEWFVD